MLALICILMKRVFSYIDLWNGLYSSITEFHTLLGIPVNGQTVVLTITTLKDSVGASVGGKIRCDAQGVSVNQIEAIKLVKVGQNNQETVYINAVGNNVNWGANVPLQWKTQAQVTKQALILEVKLQTFNYSFEGKYRCKLDKINGETYTSSDGLLKREAFHYRDCYEVQQHGGDESGIYRVYPDGVPQGADVYCDMDTDGGGWLVFQRREDGSVDFFKDWDDYKIGFGNVSHEFWLGNTLLHALVIQDDQSLRVDLQYKAGDQRFAVYDSFSIGDEASKYKLNVTGYRGDAGDAFAGNSGMKFTTKDEDNDTYSHNCAILWRSGGWWFHGCGAGSLNANYHSPGELIYWRGVYRPLVKSEMKIRPSHK